MSVWRAPNCPDVAKKGGRTTFSSLQDPQNRQVKRLKSSLSEGSNDEESESGSVMRQDCCESVVLVIPPKFRRLMSIQLDSGHLLRIWWEIKTVGRACLPQNYLIKSNGLDFIQELRILNVNFQRRHVATLLTRSPKLTFSTKFPFVCSGSFG